MTYLSPSAIAVLKAFSVQNAHKQMRAGHYGPILRRRGCCYVSLDAVERHVGRHFDQAQIEAAVAGQSHRLIVIAPTEDLPHDV